ncbi:MAG: glycine/sarcosine/betaine reductase selenoprotein B family protein [Desulfatibacillaceae bacterium]
MHIEYMKMVGDMYAQLGYPPYRWVMNEDTPPWTPLKKPLSECRLALIASGGIYVTGQVAFHFKDDVSHRVIPTGIRTEDLRITHFAYDVSVARRDPNSVFPLDTLRRLVDEDVVGALTDNAYSFMGGIYSSRKVREQLAPNLTEALLAEKADAVLLVPC